MSKKGQLFEEGEPESKDQFQFKINEKFASKYEHNERRKLLEKAKEKYGERALDIDKDSNESESSSSEEEDDDANLINPKVEKKYLETLIMIRENNPKLKELKEDLFKDSDFEQEENGNNEQKASKPITYKDLLREEILEKMSDSEDD